MSDPTPPAARYVPGAPPPTSKPKSKKKKTASSTTPASSTPALATGDSVLSTEAATPVALLSTTPSSADLPAQLKEEVKGKEERVKGPAEEMVYKRLKLLGKKIQRFTAYKSQPPTSLNPDQQAALQSLPALSGAFRELEEVGRCLETVENDLALKKKEHAVETAAKLEAAKAEAVEEYKTKAFPLISSLLTIQLSLHPSTGLDTSSYKSISPEDVARVDELIAAIKEDGVKGVDALLKEVDGGEGTTFLQLITGTTPEESPVESDGFPAPLESSTLLTESESNPAASGPMQFGTAFEQAPEAADAPASEQTQPVNAGAPQMSFIQSDELEAKEVVADEAEGGLESNEAEEPVSAATDFEAEPTKIDWADDMEDDITAPDALRKEFGLPPVASVPVAISVPSVPTPISTLPSPPIHMNAAGGPPFNNSPRSSQASWRRQPAQNSENSGPSPTNGEATSNGPEGGFRRGGGPNGFRGRGGFPRGGGHEHHGPRGGHHHGPGPNGAGGPPEDDGFTAVSSRRGGRGGGPGEGGPRGGGEGRGGFRGGRGRGNGEFRGGEGRGGRGSGGRGRGGNGPAPAAAAAPPS